MIVLYAQLIRQTGIDASHDGVERSMGRIDCYLMTYSSLDDALLSGLAAYLFEAVEEQGMMTDDELTTSLNSLIDHLRCNVCGQENGVNLTSRVTYLHSRVIPLLLGTPWRYRFYAIDYGS